MNAVLRTCCRLIGGMLICAGTAQAGTYDLTIEKLRVNFTGSVREALSINGQIPGPLLRFREGEDVTLNVTNKLDEDTSLHWHGLLVPYTQDGVPGMSLSRNHNLSWAYESGSSAPCRTFSIPGMARSRPPLTAVSIA